MTRRRTLLLTLGGVAAYWAGTRWLLSPGPAKFDFAPLEGAPGFRTMRLGAISGGAMADPFAGLSPTPLADHTPFAGDLCEALTLSEDNRVAITAFTDINCPYCRVLDKHLSTLDQAVVRVQMRQLPLLGETSLLAAKAILAAQAQGAGHAMTERLQRVRLVASPEALAPIAKSLSLDEARLVREAQGTDVAAVLQRNYQLALRLGVFATPSLVVGRTIVIGAIEPEALSRLIALEAKAPGCPTS